MAEKRKLQAEETRTKLIDATLLLLQKKSYNKISIDEICQICNVTKGAFYHHFDSKDQIFFWAFKKIDDQFLVDSLEKHMYSMDSISLLRLYFQKLTEIKKKDFSHTLQQYQILLSLANQYELLKQTKNLEYLNRIILKGKASGEFKTTLPTEYCFNLILGTISGIYMQWSFQKIEDIDKAVNQMLDVYIQFLTSK